MPTASGATSSMTIAASNDSLATASNASSSASSSGSSMQPTDTGSLPPPDFSLKHKSKSTVTKQFTASSSSSTTSQKQSNKNARGSAQASPEKDSKKPRKSGSETEKEETNDAPSQTSANCGVLGVGGVDDAVVIGSGPVASLQLRSPIAQSNAPLSVSSDAAIGTVPTHNTHAHTPPPHSPPLVSHASDEDEDVHMSSAVSAGSENGHAAGEGNSNAHDDVLVGSDDLAFHDEDKSAESGGHHDDDVVNGGNGMSDESLPANQREHEQGSGAKQAISRDALFKQAISFVNRKAIRVKDVILQLNVPKNWHEFKMSPSVRLNKMIGFLARKLNLSQAALPKISDESAVMRATNVHPLTFVYVFDTESDSVQIGELLDGVGVQHQFDKPRMTTVECAGWSVQDTPTKINFVTFIDGMTGGLRLIMQVIRAELWRLPIAPPTGTRVYTGAYPAFMVILALIVEIGVIITPTMRTKLLAV